VAAAHTVVRERQHLDGYRFDRQRFAGLNMPTLLLAGGDSPPFLQRSTAAIAAAVPGARVVTLASQQHVAMDTIPDKFAAEILSFLREATP